MRATTRSMCSDVDDRRRRRRRASAARASAALRVRAPCAQPQAHLGAGLVEHVDGAVGQLVVAQVPRGELRGGLERLVGVRHAVVVLVAAAQPLEDPHGLVDRRLVDRDLLQPPRQRAVLLDVLELLEGRRADDAELAGVRIGLIIVARSIVPPVVAPAPTVAWISSMKRIGIGRFASAAMTALKRSSKSPRKRVPASSAPVSSEKTSAPSSGSGTSSSSSRWRALRPARSCRRRRRPRTPGCSCAAGRGSPSSAAVRRAADERVEFPLAGAFGEVHGVGARAGRGPWTTLARPAGRRLPGFRPGVSSPAIGAGGTFEMPWRDVVRGRRAA
jgi:hypothetical protein